MTLPQPKMPRLQSRLLLLLLLFLLQPLPSQTAATPKPRSETFWRNFCGFFCPYQPSCDSDVYLSSKQQMELLNSQEFLDILELFPQILLENEKLQHTTLVRLEDHQRDLILLRYKDFFHPRETLPLARQRVVSQLAKDQEGFHGVPIAEPVPNEIRLTEDQVRQLLEKTDPVQDNTVGNEVLPEAEDEVLGTPNWNQAESFIRDYVNKQRIQQSKARNLPDVEGTSEIVSDGVSEKKAVQKTASKKDKPMALHINKLQDSEHLNVEQILKELEKMGHSVDLNDLATTKASSEAQSADPEPHRTTDSDPTVLHKPLIGGRSNQNSRQDSRQNSRQNSSQSKSARTKRPLAKHVNRITNKKSKNCKEPYSDSHDTRTLEDYFHRQQHSNLPSKQQLTQAIEFLNSPSASTDQYKSLRSRTGDKRTLSSESNSGHRRRRLDQQRPVGFVHEPGGSGGEGGESGRDKGSQEVSKRHSRRKREVLSLQVCPVVETWSNLVLAETVNGTLVQIAQFPEVNLEQWFLQERCLYEESKIINGVTCEIRERLVDAVVIPVVNPTQPIQRTQIKIDCCMSMFNVDLGY